MVDPPTSCHVDSIGLELEFVKKLVIFLAEIPYKSLLNDQRQLRLPGSYKWQINDPEHPGRLFNNYFTSARWIRDKR